jgi:hypothetical protein
MVNSTALEKTVRCVKTMNLPVIGLEIVSRKNIAVILTWTAVTEVTKRIVVSDVTVRMRTIYFRVEARITK